MVKLTDSPRIAPLLREDPNNPGQAVKWNVAPGGTITYSFVTPETVSTYQADLTGNSPETNIQEVNEQIKTNVRQIFREVFSPVLPLNFQEVTDSANSNIRIMFSDGPGVNGNAYGYYPDTPNIGGAIHLNANNENDPSQAYSSPAGSYGYSTLIHEIGHTLGLKHPGNYNAGSDENENAGETPFLPFSEDNSRNAIMSYNPGSAIEGEPNSEEPRTLMPYDIEALQFLYGKPQSSGEDNRYNFDSNNFNNILATIWDSGGVNTLNFSALPSDAYYFDMNPGGVLTRQNALNTLYYNLEKSQISSEEDPEQSYPTNRFGTYLAFDTKITNLIGSNGNDDVRGNSLVNAISGLNGDDILIGGKGNDTLKGDEGNDQLIGNKGLDVLIGGLGDNTLTGGKGQDIFVLDSAQGVDTILDFQDSLDQFALNGGLSFNDLVFEPVNNGTQIKVSTTGQVLAILPEIPNSLISITDFTNFVA